MDLQREILSLYTYQTNTSFVDIATKVAHELGHVTVPHEESDTEDDYDAREEKAIHYEAFFTDVIKITDTILEILHIDIEMHLSKN